jgi:tetratricopeptide (TPR) repeat protein
VHTVIRSVRHSVGSVIRSPRVARGVVLSLFALSAGWVAAGCAEVTASSKHSREQGQKLYAEGSYVDAAGAFRNAVRKDPTDYRAYYGMGQSYDATKSYHQAIQAYQTGLDVQKRTAPGREDEAMRVKLIDAMAQTMAKAYDHTLQESGTPGRPETAENKYIQAKAFAYMGDADSAIDAYNKAVLMDKKDFAIAKDYGLYLEKMPGMKGDAARQLKRAYQLNNKDPEVVAALRRVGVVPGPSLKEQDQLAKPSVPVGPFPEVDVKRWRQRQQTNGTASTADGASPTGPRD